jgi:hypothetical protein
MTWNLNPFVRYLLHNQASLPPFRGGLFEYILAANGLFVRAERPELRALIPAAACELRGLQRVEPACELRVPRVPVGLVSAMLEDARAEQDAEGAPREVLFHLAWHDGWQLTCPAQQQGGTFVAPLGPAIGSSYESALIEVHSHHAMTIAFSSMDDDEETCFRIYAVLADIFKRPTLYTRVSVYGYRSLIDSALIFSLPEAVRCGLEEEGGDDDA